MSIQYELNMMALRREGVKRCIEFWIKVMSLDEERLMKVVHDVGSFGNGRMGIITLKPSVRL